MLKKIIFIYLFCFVIVNAEEYIGSYVSHYNTFLKGSDNKKIKNDSILNYLDSISKVYLNWELYSFMGEPVVYSTGVVSLPKKMTYSIFYKEKYYNVPFEVIKKIEVVSCKVSPPLGELCSISSPYIDFDIGCNIEIFFEDTDNGYSLLSTEEKKKYKSFNSPGSPAWEKLFYINTLMQKEYLKADDAKKLFKNGIIIDSRNTALSAREIQFNLESVYNWIEEQKEEDKNSKNNPLKKVEEVNNKKDSGLTTGKVANAFENNPFEKLGKASENNEVIKGIDKD